MNTNNDILNTEADLAADFIEELLNIADYEGDIEIGVTNERPFVRIVNDKNDESENLIGDDGKTLLALQEITRLSVSNQIGDRTNLIVDVNNYRKEKEEKYIQQAKEAIENLKDEEVHMPHMNSFDRKILHDKISELGAYSYSVGKGLERHIVITSTKPDTDENTTEKSEEDSQEDKTQTA